MWKFCDKNLYCNSCITRKIIPMQKPSYKWIPFLLIALVISIIVEYLLNWSMNDVFVSSEATYTIASIVFSILLMIASLLIWYCNRLYFRKTYRRSFWNVLYNILSFIILFYLCFFVKLSVISRVISRTSLNKIFERWHIQTADTGAYETIIIFLSVQVLFLIYYWFLRPSPNTEDLVY
jgi:hypothetical protein